MNRATKWKIITLNTIASAALGAFLGTVFGHWGIICAWPLGVAVGLITLRMILK